MPDARIRSQIALLAARLMYERQESEYFTAKRKAAKQLGVEYRYRPGDLPSNAEIRDQVQALACLYEGDSRTLRLREMRLEALALMRLLETFRPRIIGSVWTGHIRLGSDIDLHVFTNHPSAITSVLDEQNLIYSVQHKRVVKHNEVRQYTHIHIADRQNFELTVYPDDKLNYTFKSSITGRAIEKATLPEFEQFLRQEYPDTDLSAVGERLEDHVDRFDLYRMLLLPLEKVKQNPAYHPEGDALYHSLQVFELARFHRNYDEEFLLAALLHDVGKAIDPADHVAAGLAALEGAITPRTQLLIAHHMDAHAYRDGTLGHRAKARLRDLPDFDDLILLSELDHAGRETGVVVCSVEEALAIVRQMEEAC